ncbi:hypothetical protein D9619_000481 [Psilocybe cf. subviscida]|uniref:G domain-containing protein n=1 Tax=Psilocybe cf. subviscida TaxID=2480587 RepID=A0A8H5BD29_9AGAR|nr:hypothetical protein D9619_000481 [Psilocybe cf. subviscida]
MPNNQQISTQIAADWQEYANCYIVPVMGPFSSGKSTFINQLLGKELVQVGHLFDPCTTDFQAIEVPANIVATYLPDWNPTKNLIIVDTPGFDDADDSLMLKKLAWWLTDTYGVRAKLAGIIYLHDMTEGLTCPSYKNFHFFESLCSSGTCKSVALGTTKWQRIPKEEFEYAEMREKQLLERFWNGMADRGSKAERVVDALSTWKLLDIVLHEGGPPIILVLGQTGVGKSMFICSAKPQGKQPIINHSGTSSQVPIDVYKVCNGKQSALLVDTPGFNHTNMSDKVVLGEIISWLKNLKRGEQVAGVIFLLDIGSHDYAHVKADKVGALLPIVLVTAQCHGGSITKERKASLIAKYGAIYQGHHFGATSQYETTWDVINHVLALNTRIPAQFIALENMLSQAEEKRTMSGLLMLFRSLFKFISHRTGRLEVRKLDFQGHQISGFEVVAIDD